MSSLSDTRPQRIAAIDALRGFDMFFLTGGLALVVAGINLDVYKRQGMPWRRTACV